MIKYRFSLEENYNKEMFVFYPKEFLRFMFVTLLDNNKVDEYICNELEKDCNNTAGAPTDECVANLNKMPVAEDESLHVDGLTKGCRQIHAVLAGLFPEGHCPHISFTPMEDPQGRIKCQESKGLEPEDFFDEDDFAAYEAFQIEMGIDPEVGFDEDCEEGNWCNAAGKPAGMEACAASFADPEGLNWFNLLNFSLYETYFRNDSTITLAQAG
jgi:hypothetical protein